MVICQRQKMMQHLHEAWGKLVSTGINKGQLEFLVLSHSMTQKGRRTRKCLLSTLLSESKWVSESHSVLPDSLRPHGLQSMELSRPEYGSGWPLSSPGDLPNPGIEPRSLTLQADSLSAEPQGKTKNTEAGSLSLLQQIFPTQEWTWGLLHCRQILYQLSYQGSPC